MNILSKLIIATALLLAPTTLMAHGYWIELEGNHKVNEPVTVKLVFGDYPAGERLTGKFLDKMKDINVYVQYGNNKREQIEMEQTNDCWIGTFTPSTSATYEVTGINDTRDVQDWTKHHLGVVRPIQYLKAYYQVGKSANEGGTNFLLDASIKKLANGKYEITVLKNGHPLPQQKIVISGYGNYNQEPTTSNDGRATIKLKKKGLHVMSIDWIDKTPGTYKNKKYETIRHRLDYSLYY